MGRLIKAVSILSLLTILSLFAQDSSQTQKRHLPVAVTYRKALLTRSYVLQIQNSSNEGLNLWLQAKGKISQFLLPVGKTREFGWAQGYHFDANNLFRIGGDGYDTIISVMPNIELAPWRFSFPRDGGLGLSFSQSYIQEKLVGALKLPLKIDSSSIVQMSVKPAPQIIFREGSDKIYANVFLEASLVNGNLQFPIVTSASFIVYYDAVDRQLGVSQIKLENIDVKGFPKEYLDGANQIVNRAVTLLFSNKVILQLEDSWVLKIAKFFSLRTRVSDSRLEILIL